MLPVAGQLQFLRAISSLSSTTQTQIQLLEKYLTGQFQVLRAISSLSSTTQTQIQLPNKDKDLIFEVSNKEDSISHVDATESMALVDVPCAKKASKQRGVQHYDASSTDFGCHDVVLCHTRPQTSWIPDLFRIYKLVLIVHGYRVWVIAWLDQKLRVLLRLLKSLGSTHTRCYWGMVYVQHLGELIWCRAWKTLKDKGCFQDRGGDTCEKSLVSYKS
ncbi:uncharacterized protein LOC125493123 [Beta vulgaris subsp. vulgaris]|uniref:uncharacterized protein LOC125493123 n=1 Tax=Beta vulgaris subsp. vulgaris TaxID=3555 RepID=UPI002036F1BD|nr:uncharacterized protein LOC125493123 [Beta vulgaris subsp. vulgaris]